MIFWARLLSVWYDLSDVRLAEALDDHASFRRFYGFLALELTLERTAFIRFQHILVSRSLVQLLFETITAQLKARAILKRYIAREVYGIIMCRHRNINTRRFAALQKGIHGRQLPQFFTTSTTSTMLDGATHLSVISAHSLSKPEPSQVRKDAVAIMQRRHRKGSVQAFQHLGRGAIPPMQLARQGGLALIIAQIRALLRTQHALHEPNFCAFSTRPSSSRSSGRPTPVSNSSKISLKMVIHASFRQSDALTGSAHYNLTSR